MFAKTVGKTLCRLTVVDTFSGTLSEVVANTIAITITRVKVGTRSKQTVTLMQNWRHTQMSTQ